MPQDEINQKVLARLPSESEYQHTKRLTRMWRSGVLRRDEVRGALGFPATGDESCFEPDPDPVVRLAQAIERQADAVEDIRDHLLGL